MKILLINPTYMNEIPHDVYFSMTGYTLPHLGLGYVASYLEENGYEVEILECMAMGISNEQLYKMLKNKRYDIVGISVYSGNQVNAIRILKHIKTHLPDTFVYFGGYTATLMCKQLLRQNHMLDCCVIGEGEITTLELVKFLENGTDISDIQGIAYRRGNDVVVNSQRKLVEDLDELPFPKRVFYSKRGEATIVSSRGCLNSCIYCAINSYYRHSIGRKFRSRSAISIVAEIEHILKENPGVRTIGFYDDNFLANTEDNIRRIKGLIELIRAKNLKNIDFYITVCADDICANRDLLADFCAVGLRRVFVGIESFSERQLRFYKKRATLQENIEAIRILKNLGIEISVGFVPYDPFVTLEEIEQNFKTVYELDYIGQSVNVETPYSLCTPLIAVPDTEFRMRIEAENMLVFNERGYVFCDELVREYFELKEKWVKANEDFTSELFYVLIAREKNQDDYRTLAKLKMDYIKLDLVFLIELCTYVKEEETEKIQWEDYLRMWLMRSNQLYMAFMEIAEKYQDTWEKEYFAY